VDSLLNCGIILLRTNPTQDVNSVTNATVRLEEMVCRLNMRGIAAEAINPNFCLSDLA